MSNLVQLAEAVGAPWKVFGAPQATEASDEDTVRAVFERVNGFDMINHSLAQRTIGQSELAAVERAKELQWTFLSVDGNDPVSRDEWMGAHDLVWLGLRCDSLRHRSSQRGLVAAFVRSGGVSLAWAAGKRSDSGELAATVFAIVVRHNDELGLFRMMRL